MAYRQDFIFGWIAGVSSDLAGLLFIGVVFSNLPDVRGWMGWQVATIFALNSLCYGLASTLFNGIWSISGRAYSGELNHFLVRPSNPLRYSGREQDGDTRFRQDRNVRGGLCGREPSGGRGTGEFRWRF